MKRPVTTSTRKRFTPAQKHSIYQQWLSGITFAEMAKVQGAHRQTTRGIVLSFKPKLEDYRKHDHFRRLRMFGHRAG